MNNKICSANQKRTNKQTKHISSLITKVVIIFRGATNKWPSFALRLAPVS